MASLYLNFWSPGQAPEWLRSQLWMQHIIRELCELMDMQKVRTSPYHAQTNGQVEWAHQMLMHMIGKLGRDWKVDWLKHLPTSVHAYNSAQLAITRYSLHYLMYGCQPCISIDFYFPMKRGTKKHQCVDHHIAELHEWLWKPLKGLRCSSH